MLPVLMFPSPTYIASSEFLPPGLVKWFLDFGAQHGLCHSLAATWGSAFFKHLLKPVKVLQQGPERLC